jgi:hypothetical protein
MRKITLNSAGLVLVLGVVFIISSLEVCLAEKPKFKVKYNPLNKKAELTVTISLPEYEISEEDEWIMLRCMSQDANPFLRKGEPDLFSFTCFISIPQEAEVKKIKVKPQGKRIKLTKPIKPVPEAVPIGGPSKSLIPDEKIYNSPQPYPKQDFDYALAKQGSTSLLVLTVYPFKYIGKHQTLLVNEYVKVDIVLKAKKWEPNPKPRNAVDKHLKNKLLNPEEAFFSEGGVK